jgi:uncharacterized protein YdeI (YjbR/CyaY-like superfamily)
MASPTASTAGNPERPATFFESPEEFRDWLAANHETASELWMGLRKKHVEPRGLTWAQAVPEALCFGWIDSVVQSLGPDAVRQRWTPRRAGSTWSKVNVALVAQLEAEGRMQPAGRAAYERGRADRTGIYAYEQADAGAFPPEYAARLAASPAAAAFWDRAPAAYRKQVIHWVLSAKQQATRDRRMEQVVGSCAAYLPIPPQRYGDEPAWMRRARAELGGPASGPRP